MYDDDFPTPKQAGSTAIKWGLTFILVMFVLGMAAWALGIVGKVVTKPVDTTIGVVDRVLDPDHALETYRWFHGSYQQIQAKKTQITLSKQAYDAAAADRKEARRVELMGLQQGCMNLVGEYNAKAQRADTVIFQHPERFLPGDWPGDRNPLPQAIDLNECM